MFGSGSKLLKIFVTLILISFFGYQIYALVYKPITTATAVNFEAFDGVDIEGYFVRQEKVLDYQPTGNERYVVGEGEKVSKGGVIAEVYSGPAVAAAQVKISELNSQIETLESINSVSDPSSVDLNTLNLNIKNVYADFLTQKNDGCFINADSLSNELLLQLNKKQIITGQVQNFDSLIASLKAQVTSLSASVTPPTKTISSDASGFFVSNIDGLEEILSIDKIESMNVSVFDQIKSAKKGDGFGKIVTSYDWYIVSKMTGDDYLKFSVGDKVTLKTTIDGSEELSATVYKINVADKENEALVIFSCNMLNGALSITRSAKMTVVTESYSGIRISNKAIRVVDGQTGVYVIQGSIVKFRPIEIIYTADTYSICKNDDTGNNKVIRLYDEVIEKGKNLYDGKYIN